MSSGLKHSAQEDQVNGELSPAKVPKVDGEKVNDGNVDQLSHEERLSRVRDFFTKSGKMAPPITKPKPKPKKPSVVVTGEDAMDGSTTQELSPSSTEDPGPILLDPQSLAQFGQIADFDFDAVIRQQMLDNTPQKDRAALSQSKGLQNRRLPGQFASKVPEDYASRRRALTYSVGDVNRNPRLLVQGFEETDSVREEEEMTEEEKKKKILAKAGISQTNPLAALGNILKRGSGGLRSSGRSKSSKKSPTDSPTPQPKLKPKKHKTPTSSPLPEKKSSESAPKSPKGFRLLRRSSSRKKGNGGLDSGSTEDLKSETSSIGSFNIHPAVREEELMEAAPSPQQPSSVERSPARENGAMDTSTDTTKSPFHSAVNTTSSSSEKRYSAYFKTPQVESLFGSDSALFDTGELEALLGKGKSRFNKEKTPDRALEPTQEEPQGREKEKKEERAPKGSAVKARLQLYERNENTKPLSASTPKTDKPAKKTRLFESLEDEDVVKSKAAKEDVSKPSEKPEAKSSKGTGLFEDPGEDEELFSSKDLEKEKEKPDTDTQRKKARLFEDELFQDDLKPTEPKVAESPKQHTEEVASSSSKQQVETSASPEDEPDIGHDVSSTDHEPSSPTGVSLAKTPAKEEEKQKADETEPPGILSYEESPQLTAKAILEKRKSKEHLEEFAESLFGEFESRWTSTKSTDKTTEAEKKDEKEQDKTAESLFEDVPSKPRKESKGTAAEEREELDKIAESLFEDVSSKPRKESKGTTAEEREELDKIAESLFGEVTKSPTKEGRRASAKTSVEKMEILEPVSDPLGAVTGKTQVEKESVEREKENQTGSLEEKTVEGDLFDDDAMDIKVPLIHESKSSHSKDDETSEISEKETTTDVSEVPMESSSTPTPPDTKMATEEVEEKKAESKEKEDSTTKPTGTRATSKKEEPKRTSRLAESNLKSDSKVSSVRSKFDSKSSSTSVNRSRKTTAESVKSAAERKARTPAKEEKKDAEGGKPSWIIELQKRKEGKKERDTKQKTPPKEATKEAAIPEWQKRVLERRKRSTEEKASPLTSRSDRLGKSTSSPKSPRANLRSPNSGTNLPAAGRKSPATGKKSPTAGRNSPRSTAETRTKSPARGRNKEEASADTKGDQPSVVKPPLSKKPDKTAKAKIEISSKRVEAEKKPNSKEEEKKPSWEEEIKSPALNQTDKKVDVNDKDKSRAETDDDVFLEKAEDSATTTEKPRHTPSPHLSSTLLSSVLTKDNGGSGSRHSSTSSDHELGPSERPFRSQSLSHSRSPTPTGQTGPLKLSSSSSSTDVPEWKKKLMERKRSGTTAAVLTSRRPQTKAKEPEIPPWKKELMAKKAAKSTDTKKSLEVRTTRLSRSVSNAERRKEMRATPDFMKEFQQRKQRVPSKE